MQNRSGTFGEEVTDQVGIFLSVVTGFVVAQGWNKALLEYSSKYKTEENEDWYTWVYAIVLTFIALTIMIIWGYFIARNFSPPSKAMRHLL
jgi:hypothetical protein